MVWSVLKEVRSKKSSAASIWLDIAKAYGSIPNKLIFCPPEIWNSQQVDTNSYIILCRNLQQVFFKILLPVVGIDISVEYLQAAQFLSFRSLQA